MIGIPTSSRRRRRHCIPLFSQLLRNPPDGWCFELAVRAGPVPPGLQEELCIPCNVEQKQMINVRCCVYILLSKTEFD